MHGHASTSATRQNIHGAKVMLSIWWGQLGVVYYKLLKASETNAGAWYRTQLMHLSRALKEKQPEYTNRKTLTDQDILGNAKIEGLNPICRTLQTLLLPTNICFDRWHAAYHISTSALMKKSKNGLIRGLPQKTHRFVDMVSQNYEKDGKK